MERILQDARYGLRTLGRNKGFTAVAIVVLALGIGTSTAMFTLVNSILLKSLPYPHADRLVWMGELDGERGISVAYPDFRDWQQRNRSFESMAALQSEHVTLTGFSEPRVITSATVTADYLHVLGLTPESGRDFTVEDDRPGAEPVVLVRRGFAEQLFGVRDPIGRTLTLDKQSFTIIGVAPAGTSYDDPVDIMRPLGLQEKDLLSRDSHPGIVAVGRLKPGVNFAQARDDLTRIGKELATEFPVTNSKTGIYAESLLDQVIGKSRQPLWMLLVAGCMILLIACANVANLLLARGAARTKEFAIRLTLGASRGRLIRQLLTESLLLATLAGGCGLLLAFWGVRAGVRMAASTLPRADEIQVDTSVLLFTIVVAAVTGILFGLVPALQTTSPDVNESLKGAAGWLSSRNRRYVRQSFVAFELALSLVLLVGAGLLIRSFSKLNAIDPGFKYEGVTTAYVMPPANDRQKNAQLYTEILANLRQQAGTDRVALDYPIPMSGRGWQSDYRIEGDPIPADLHFVNADMSFVSPSFFSVMEVPLVGGRVFTDQETYGSPRVTVVNQTFARNHGGAAAVIGRRLRLGGPEDLRKDEDPDSPWATIVGVVGDVHQYSLEKAPREAVYQSLWQRPTGITAVYLRPQSSQADAGEMIRKAVRAADPDQPIMRLQPLSAVMQSAIAPRKMTMTLLTIFAALALAMAIVGIYGVMSYTVVQRTREIGIRMALGARTADVIRIFLAEGARVALIGLLLGTVASVATTRLIASLLYGVTSLDPATFVAVALVIGTAALFACWLPSMRAAQVDPMKTLRDE